MIRISLCFIVWPLVWQRVKVGVTQGPRASPNLNRNREEWGKLISHLLCAQAMPTYRTIRFYIHCLFMHYSESVARGRNREAINFPKGTVVRYIIYYNRPKVGNNKSPVCTYTYIENVSTTLRELHFRWFKLLLLIAVSSDADISAMATWGLVFILWGVWWRVRKLSGGV